MRRDEYALEVHARRGTGRNTKASAGGGNPRVPESPPASTQLGRSTQVSACVSVMRGEARPRDQPSRSLRGRGGVFEALGC